MLGAVIAASDWLARQPESSRLVLCIARVKAALWLKVSPHWAFPGARDARTGWQLLPVGALPSNQRIVHVTWNRTIATEVAFLLEDGSAHLLDCAPACAQLCTNGSSGLETLQVACDSGVACNQHRMCHANRCALHRPSICNSAEHHAPC